MQDQTTTVTEEEIDAVVDWGDAGPSGREDARRALETRRRYLKVPNELGDGEHWTALSLRELDGRTAADCIINDLAEWAKNATAGESITFGVLDLTDEQFDNLEEI
jgi:hypothetical protein